MFCTDDERNSCQKEKMGCKGCYYDKDNKEIIKYIKNLENKIEDLKIQKNYYKKMYLESNDFFKKGCK